MENASKALIIAGSVLIALLVISLGVMVYRNFSQTVVENSDLSEQEISSINSKITPYLGDNVSGSKVNALISTVYSINRNLDTNKISVECDGKEIIKKDGDYNSTQKKVETGVYYTVSEGYNNNTGLINSITITKN